MAFKPWMVDVSTGNEKAAPIDLTSVNMVVNQLPGSNLNLDGVTIAGTGAISVQNLSITAAKISAGTGADWQQLIYDSTVPGLSWRTDTSTINPCRVVATTNITLTAPGTTIDGVTLNTNDRILLTGQTTSSQNGSYIFNGSSSTLTRTSDANAGTRLTSGTLITVWAGTAGANSIWTLSTDGAITVGTTNLTFTRLNTSGGSGTVTSVSVVTANGISGTVATSTTTPAITLSLGAITPTSIKTTGTINTGGIFINGSGATFPGQNMADGTTVPTLLTVSTTLSTYSEALCAYSADALAGTIYFTKSRGTVVNTQAPVNSGDSLGSFNFQGVNSSNTLTSAGVYSTNVYGTPGSTYVGLQYNWTAGTNAAAPTTLLTLDASTGLNAATTVRATGSTAATSGSGTELLFSAGTGIVQAYNRSSSAFLPLVVQGSTIGLNSTTQQLLATSTGLIVGIGTSTQTMSNSVVPALQTLGTSLNTTSKLIATYSADANGGAVYFLKSRGTSIGSLVTPNPSDSIGQISFQAVNNNSTPALASAGVFSGNVFGIPGTTYTGLQYSWTAATSASAPATVMTLDASGGLASVLGIRAQGNITASTGVGAEMLYDGTNARFHGYNRSTSAYIPVLYIGTTHTFSVSGTSVLAINSTNNITSNALIDNAGTIRATNQIIPASGAGIELLYASGIGYLQSYNRSTSVFQAQQYNALTHTFTISGTTILGLSGSTASVTGAISATGAISGTQFTSTQLNTSGNLQVTGGLTAGAGPSAAAVSFNGTSATYGGYNYSSGTALPTIINGSTVSLNISGTTVIGLAAAAATVTGYISATTGHANPFGNLGTVTTTASVTWATNAYILVASASATLAITFSSAPPAAGTPVYLRYNNTNAGTVTPTFVGAGTTIRGVPTTATTTGKYTTYVFLWDGSTYWYIGGSFSA